MMYDLEGAQLRLADRSDAAERRIRLPDLRNASAASLDLWLLFVGSVEIGSFWVEREPAAAIMKFVKIDRQHRGKGFGQKVYRTLAKHYGVLESDRYVSTPGSYRVWERIGTPLQDRNADGEPRYRLAGEVGGQMRVTGNLLFVYGTLRLDEEYSWMMATAQYVGPARASNVELYDFGDFPAGCRGNGVIVGELYDVTDELLADLDEFEEVPTLHTRERVTVAPGGSAWAYLMPASVARDGARVPDGNWSRQFDDGLHVHHAAASVDIDSITADISAPIPQVVNQKDSAMELMRAFGPALLERIGISDVEALNYLGSGTYGSAFAIDEQHVLKVTEDVTEANSSAHLIGKPLDNVAVMFDVFRFGITGFYGIVQERLEKLMAFDKVDLRAAIATVRLNDLLMQLDFDFERAVKFAHDSAPNEYVQRKVDAAVASLRKLSVDAMCDQLIANGVRFRDYSSSNVMQRRDGTYVVTDLGVSISPRATIDVIQSSVVTADAERTSYDPANRWDAGELLQRFHGAIEERLGEAVNIDTMPYLGSGSCGSAFAIDDKRVLKVTDDLSEAQSSAALIGTTLEHVVEIYDVFQFGQLPYYGLVTERLEEATESELGSRLTDLLTQFSISRLIKQANYDFDKMAERWQADADAVAEKESKPQISKNVKARIDLLRECGVDKMAEELLANGIKFSDYAANNVMLRRGGGLVVNDLGFSTSPHVELPVVGSAAPRSATLSGLSRNNKKLLRQARNVRVLPFSKLSSEYRNAILVRADDYGLDESDLDGASFGCAEVPMPALQAAIASDTDIADDFDSFADYHKWYMANMDVPSHGSSVWPVILSQYNESVLDDGSHRLHSYIERGLEWVPVVWQIGGVGAATAQIVGSADPMIDVLEADTEHLPKNPNPAVKGEATAVIDAFYKSLRDRLGRIVGFRYLGHGDYGSAFEIGDHRVLKITCDGQEAQTAANLIGKKLHWVAEFYDVFRFGNLNVWGIEQELLRQLSDEDADAISQAVVVTDFRQRLRAANYDVEKVLDDILADAEEGDIPNCTHEEAEHYVSIIMAMRIPEMVEELLANNIRFIDYHGGNLMSRHGKPVITDLGRSGSPAVKIDAIEQVAAEVEASDFAEARFAVYLNEIPPKYRNLPVLGRGNTSITLEKDANTVLVFTRDVMKREWLVHHWGLGIGDDVEQLTGRLHPDPAARDLDIYVVEMPKLVPLSGANKAIVNKELRQFEQVRSAASQMAGSYSDQLPYYIIQLYQERHPDSVLSKVMEFASNYGADQFIFDFAPRQFMQTPSGELVVLDPVASKEVLDVIHGGGRGKMRAW